ncbi:unnamed protein product [Spirodela intermedia]|uniref:BHLH domain-containing protein n=2 Tax=Spirodela intermedia TaxID=51605 RepID=A0A7I8L6Z2_SPIIN|nr:unnamed protein product [Spirodela intermedia]CAA6668891.1 unnamed protein product [Spirodela intermedia]CAA7405801.1 unnamed protein product [Spirodela intermedia]
MEGLSKQAPGEGKQKRRRSLAQPSPSRWRSPVQQLSYTTDLVCALRRVRRVSSPSLAATRAVREAADRILAAAARGRSRWSRSILSTRRRSLKLLRRRRRGPLSASSRGPPATLERKVKMLGRLVPGCRKLPLAALLKEASDYVAALEMQVQAMAALAQTLSTTPQDRSS